MYKVIATVEGMRESFVDWYRVESEEEAKELWLKDAKMYGVPIEKTIIKIEKTE